jgi:hypothetical protein
MSDMMNENTVATKLAAAEMEISRLKDQFDTLTDAIDDILKVFRSGANADIKLMRIEDLLSSAVSDAANI